MKFKELTRSKFFTDNIFLLIGALMLNGFGFLFHFYLGRQLGPENYGVLAVIMAFIGILGIPYATLQLSISKFATVYHTRGEEKKLSYLYNASLHKLLKIFTICFLLSLLVSWFFLAKFWRIDFILLAAASLLVLLTPHLSVSRGFLQGLQDFKALGISLSYEGIVKFCLSAILVLMGFSVGGAVLGVIASYFVAAVYSYTKIPSFKKNPGESIPTKEIFAYTLPVFFTLLLFTLFYSVDLLLVRRFFSDLDAGYFSVINIIGKIVFYASFSVVQVMFPKVVALAEQKKPHKEILQKSMLLIILIVAPIITVYFLFDKLIITLLFGKEYIVAASLIGFYAIFMAFVSLSKLFCFYLLSLKKFSFLFVLAFFTALEIVLISLFHTSLLQITSILITLSIGLFLVLGYLSLYKVQNA